MSAPSKSSRSLRRYVRFLCEIVIGERSFRAVCSNLSASGLFVRVARDNLAESTIVPGKKGRIGFRLPVEHRLIASDVEVVWTDPDDRDIAGRPTIGLGLRLESLGRESQQSIAHFIENFRYAVLLVDSNRENLEAMQTLLGDDYRVMATSSAVEALEILESSEVAVVVIDDRMRTVSGAAVLQRHYERLPRSHALQITLSQTPESRRVDAHPNLGRAFQVIRRPIEGAELQHAVRRAVDAYSLGVENERLNEELERANSQLMRENKYLRRKLDGLTELKGLVGKSQALARTLSDLERIQQSEAPVHIEGETGTGKDLVARALHFGGARANGPFVHVNCRGLTGAMLDSTLFGHRQGAIAGADRDRMGAFQEANGGTLFLDGITDLSASAQAGVLRVLQEREVVKLGDAQAVRVDVRILSASHEDLREKVEAGLFREDLYFRLRVLSVTLPPLRSREGDVALLAQHFLELLSERYGKVLLGFEPEALQALEQYRWPGNVRELENEVERLVVLTQEGGRVTSEHLSSHIRAARRPVIGAHDPDSIVVPVRLPYDEAMSVVQREMVERAMSQSDGLVSRAAEILGVERSRLVKLRQRLGLA